jgi:hypothetical protein
MPGTVHLVAVEQALGQRAVIVRAGGTDGKDVLAVARQQDSIVADMAGKHGAVGKRGLGDALREVGPSGLFLVVGHCLPPLRCHGKPAEA